jgi:hypothetical protein
MRKAFRHSGVLMMVAVVALGLLGAAYTLWYEDLQLNTTVTTGTFDADVSIHPWDSEANEFGAEQTAEDDYDGAGRPVVAVFDAPILNSRSAHYQARQGGPAVTPAGYALFGDNFTQPAGEKPAPTCDASIGQFGSIAVNTNDVVDSNQLNLEMSGLFPYAGCEYMIDIHNSGSVPMHISILPDGLYQMCNFDGTGCVDISTSWPALSFIADPSNDARCAALFGFGASTDPDTLGQLQVGGVPVQIHGDNPLVCKIKIIMDQAYDGEHVMYKVQLNWRTYQWNEVPGVSPNPPAPAFRDGVNGPFDKLP